MSPSVYRILGLLFAGLVGLGTMACGGGGTEIVIDDEEGPVPSPAETRKALNEALQAFNEYCLAPAAERGEPSYPISLVASTSGSSSYRYRQLWALTRAGLLDTTRIQHSGGVSVHRFDLTAAGQKNRYEIAQGAGYKPMFCYAIPRVTDIDSIKARFNSGPNPLAEVWFEYRYETVGSWVESPPVQRSFSDVAPPPPSQSDRATEMLLVRVDSAWVDRRLTGYERPPERPHPPSGR